MRQSKRVATNATKRDPEAKYALAEAVTGVKSCANAKFDESVDLAFHLGVDPRHADQMIRGSVALPHGTGRNVRVVVACKQEAQANAAREAGAEEVGGDELIAKIAAGWTDFDAMIAAPDMMGSVGKLGKILGPRGLMPSPKAGTVTPNVGNAVKDIKKGKIDFRVDKNANIHVPVGKASFTAEQISENAGAVIGAIVKAKPASAKGIYLKSCTISSTMGPGYKLDTAKLQSSLDEK